MSSTTDKTQPVRKYHGAAFHGLSYISVHLHHRCAQACYDAKKPLDLVVKFFGNDRAAIFRVQDGSVTGVLNLSAEEVPIALRSYTLGAS